MAETSFKCSVCKKELPELWFFGQYGNNRFKTKDNNPYCEKHFEEADAKHDASLENAPAEE